MILSVFTIPEEIILVEIVFVNMWSIIVELCLVIQGLVITKNIPFLNEP